MQTLKKLLKLSAPEAVVLAEAAILLPLVRVACRFVTFARLQRLSGRRRRQPRPSNLRPEAAARLVRIAAERGLYRARCLEKSLVLCWILCREGVAARIRLGARKEENEVQAHAWVEVDGVSLDDVANVHAPFSPFEKIATSDAN